MVSYVELADALCSKRNADSVYNVMSDDYIFNELITGEQGLRDKMQLNITDRGEIQSFGLEVKSNGFLVIRVVFSKTIGWQEWIAGFFLQIGDTVGFMNVNLL